MNKRKIKNKFRVPFIGITLCPPFQLQYLNKVMLVHVIQMLVEGEIKKMERIWYWVTPISSQSLILIFFHAQLFRLS